MALYYNVPNETGLIGLMRYSNNVTNDIFGITLLFMIFSIMFVSFKARNHGTGESMGAASFVSMVSSVFLWIINVVPDYSIIVTTILTVISIIIMGRSD